MLKDDLVREYLIFKDKLKRGITSMRLMTDREQAGMHLKMCGPDALFEYDTLQNGLKKAGGKRFKDPWPQARGLIEKAINESSN